MRRQKFLRFYWHAKKYLKTKVIEDKLPHLSGKLTGELVQFTHGDELNAVDLFLCDDKDEQHRFHIAMAETLSTKLIDAEESVTIDGLHVVLEGLLLYNGKIKSKGKILGVLEYVCGCPKEYIRTATAMTFSACTYSAPEFLQAVLRTNRYPTIARHMNTVVVQAKFRSFVLEVVRLCRWWQKGNWSVEHQERYRKALYVVGDDNSTDVAVEDALKVIEGETTEVDIFVIDPSELYKNDPVRAQLCEIQTLTKGIVAQMALTQGLGKGATTAGTSQGTSQAVGILSECQAQITGVETRIGGLELQVGGVKKEMEGLAAKTEERMGGMERQLEGLATKTQQVLNLLILRSSYSEFVSESAEL
jgi:hypothetical protein